MSNLRNVDEKFAARVADGLVMDLPKAAPTAAPVLNVKPSPALRIIRRPLEKHTLEGLVVSILIANGSDAGEIGASRKGVEKAGGHAMLIAPRGGTVSLADGKKIADAQLFGQPSVAVDACAVILSEEACAGLLKECAAVQWVMDAFAHRKAIDHNDASESLLDKASVEPDEGVTNPRRVEVAKKRYWDREPKVRTLA